MTLMAFEDVTLAFRMMIDQPTPPYGFDKFNVIENDTWFCCKIEKNLSDGVNKARKYVFLEFMDVRTNTTVFVNVGNQLSDCELRPNEYADWVLCPYLNKIP